MQSIIHKQLLNARRPQQRTMRLMAAEKQARAILLDQMAATTPHRISLTLP